MHHHHQIDQMMARAVQSYHAGYFDEVELILSQVLTKQSKNIEALQLLGIVKGVKHLHREALELFRKALKIDSNNSFLHFNIAKALSEMGEEEKALQYHLNATKLNPSFPGGWMNFAKSLSNLNRLDESLVCYDKVTGIQPDYAEAWSNRANVLSRQKQYEQALASYEKAIEINPDYAEAWFNHGITLTELKRYEEALTSYDKAISNNHDYAEAWANRGNVLIIVCRFEQAEASYRQAIRLAPENSVARSMWLFSANYLESLSPGEALDEAKEFGLKVSGMSIPKFNEWNIALEPKKLKIGFVSGDLCNHPVGYFIEGLSGALNPNQFELYAFPTNPSNDDLTDRIKHIFTEWTPIFGMSDQEAASAIHQKEIHVLIDLSGHSRGNRLPVFSYKPAPVQVSWLGYFATTGLPEMDYFLGDPYMSPKLESNHFTEFFWNLSETWLCLKPPSFEFPVSELPALKNGFVTFGSFANLSKMNDRVVRTWASVLNRIPTAKLFLKANQFSDLTQTEGVRKQYEQYGINSDRLILEGPDSRSAYFQAYNKVDVVLDAFPYPGGTTSVDALWMGVPVLTVKGDRFLSHLGESIAVNAGNTEWIAHDLNDYVEKAVQLTSDIERLANHRLSLRERVLKSPLFDTDRFAKNFSDALWGMWFQKTKSLPISPQA